MTKTDNSGYVKVGRSVRVEIGEITPIPGSTISVSFYGINETGAPVQLRAWPAGTVTGTVKIVTREEWLAAGGTEFMPSKP